MSSYINLDCSGSSGAEGMLGQSSTASGCNAQSVGSQWLDSYQVCTKEGCAAFYKSPTLSTISFVAVFETAKHYPKGSSACCEYYTKWSHAEKIVDDATLFGLVVFFVYFYCLLLYNLMTVNNAIPTTLFYVANRQSLRLKWLRIKTHLVQVKGLCMWDISDSLSRCVWT